MVYYNEHDAATAGWLRVLMAEGHLPDGDVDDRDIQDVKPSDLAGYIQCHFFAGIGGWPYALQLAGWGDAPVWTGSCPCQPFSQAGQRKGFDDSRHLWPVWEKFIAECRPPVVFGEQVASPAGRAWLAAVFADVEALGYRRAGADLCAAGVEAPHIRQRLFWVADTKRASRWTVSLHQHDGRDRTDSGRAEAHREFGARREVCRVAWADLDWLPCIDGKHRPTQPGLFPLAHGVPARVGRLRGYGNAIVPQVAAEFIQAYKEDWV